MHGLSRLVFAAAAGMLVTPAAAAAQRAVDLPPAGARPTAPAFPRAERSRLLAGPVVVAVDSALMVPPVRRRPLWPRFALSGAALGAVTVVGLAATHCDQGCRDDGGWGYVPYFAGAAALVGGAAGALVGAVVDLARRHPPRPAAPSRPGA